MTVITSVSRSQSQIDLAGYEKLKRMQSRRRRRTERALARDRNPNPVALTWVRKWKSAFIQRKQQSAEH